jgi:hypothetical protein
MMRRSWKARTLLAALVALAALVVGGSALAIGNAAPTNTAPPTISGTPTVGETLTASPGTWTATPTAYAYQWLRCTTGGNSCVAVANGTQKTYTLVGADAGHTIRVRVTATNADGSGTVESAQTATVVAASSAAAPKNTSPPTISGTPKVGEQLTADPGTWTGNPTSFSYQWQRCDADVAACSDVVGANGKVYGVQTADLGYRLRVTATAKNAKGSGTATSAITTVVIPAVTITNHRPVVSILNVQVIGATVYARFRICDDSFKNLTITETDSRPGRAPYTRQFATLAAPRPCGVYTRHWVPVARFRGRGSYTVTLRARDASGLTSLPVRRTLPRG